MNQILIKIFTPQELNHSSYIQTGLFELEKESFLKTKINLSFSQRLGTIRINDKEITETQQSHPKTSFYQLVDIKSGKKINFATDLYDASYSFSKYALDYCDFVFKRNYKEEDIKKLSKNYQDKIYPLGLSFKVKPDNGKNKYVFYLGVFVINVIQSIKLDSLFFNRLKRTIKKQIQHCKNAYNSNDLESYEKFNFVSPENSVLFQTRCFPSEEQNDVFKIHQQRYRIILALRKRFGDLFKGGFIPSNLAKAKYPNALTNLPTDPDSYLELVKKSKVVIYTRGLIYSPAWKMAEYLSQGKVIVAEKLTAELPVPLENGKEVLFFEDEKELILLIEKVLNDSQLSEVLSHNAKKYFDSYVHPKENMRRIITFMLNQNK
ncbi:glycosyltransferase family protein [Flavobacterium terrae]|uniref:Spore protein YkvP/CgeB glycosyl transferase-like domain-containing protein n=1 Tax=Flavobacterium terrae TaxID=415425 RepID=A0A1M6FRP0_9FLAO|nr:glycosyltransferase family 1 protein [Flavobacterium terrae]SHJ00367.1 hypothetical protein SAMN05444363_2308 [Flavobacterium terrae]